MRAPYEMALKQPVLASSLTAAATAGLRLGSGLVGAPVGYSLNGVERDRVITSGRRGVVSL